MSAGLNSMSTRLLTRFLGRPPTAEERAEFKGEVRELLAGSRDRMARELLHRIEYTDDPMRRAGLNDAMAVVRGDREPSP